MLYDNNSTTDFKQTDMDMVSDDPTSRIDQNMNSINIKISKNKSFHLQAGSSRRHRPNNFPPAVEGCLSTSTLSQLLEKEDFTLD